MTNNPNKVQVIVTGPTGSGKTAVYMEIVAALQAVGLKVEHADEAAFRSVMNMGEGDSYDALQMYAPIISMFEVNQPRAVS